MSELPERASPEAIEAWLRSPWPSDAGAPPRDTGYPRITDIEERPIKMVAVLIDDPELLFFDDHAVVAMPLDNGSAAVAFHDAEEIAEIGAGSQVALYGAWANVELHPPENDWGRGRMFVIDRYALLG